MVPAEVDIVLAHIADATAALPQIIRYLGDMLAQVKENNVLGKDNLIEIGSPT